MTKKSLLVFLFIFASFVLNANNNIKSKIPPYNEEFNKIYQVLSGKSKTEEKVQALKELREISKKENGRYYILSLQLLEKTVQSTRDPIVFTESIRYLSTRTDAEIDKEKKSNFMFFVDKKISNIDLSNITIKYVNFANATLENVNFENSNFENVFFNSVKLSKVSFNNSSFIKTTFNNSSMQNIKFTNSKFNIVNLGVSSIKDADFTNAVFEKAILKGSIIENSNFSNVKFNNSSLNYTKFTKATNFSNAIFTNIDLSYSDIEKTQGLTEEMLKGTFIIEGEKQPVLPSYLKDLNIDVKDKDLRVLQEQTVVN